MVSELSILLPVYNQNIVPLVEVLLQQAASLTIPFEILVYDDGSSPEILRQNSSVAAHPCVRYQELGKNVGRSKIRYLLAQEATYGWLLFLDNDMLPVRQDFLPTYVSATTAAVAVGGVAYQNTYPPQAKLRWLYGRSREQATAQERQMNPYQRIFFSNLFVRKDLLLSSFPHLQVSGYGHEDTLFAYCLQQKQVPVQHLNNPAYHLGLEEASVFLEKTEQAIQNLVYLQRTYSVAQESRLATAFSFLRQTQIANLVQKQSDWLLPLLRRQLLSTHPSLVAFDFYRLVLLCKYRK